MVVEEALDVLAQEIGLVLDTAAFQPTLRAPLLQGVLGQVQHQQQVRQLYPVEQHGIILQVFIHRQALLSPFVAVWQGSARRAARSAPGATCACLRQSKRLSPIS